MFVEFCNFLCSPHGWYHVINLSLGAGFFGLAASDESANRSTDVFLPKKLESETHIVVRANVSNLQKTSF